MADGEKVERALNFNGKSFFGSVTATGVKGAKPKSPLPED